MNRGTLLTKNACIIYQQNYAFVIASIAPFRFLGKCHIVLAFREFILNLVMTCRYLRLHHMIVKVISVLACIQDMLFDNKALFWIGQSNRFLHHSSIPMLGVWLQNDYTAHSRVEEIYCYLCFCYRTVLCNDSETKKNLREIPWNPGSDILRSHAPHSYMGFHHFWSQYIWERWVFKRRTTTCSILLLFVVLTLF